MKKTNTREEKITNLSLELLEMFFRMMESKRKKETFYINKISEKLLKIIEKEKKEAFKDGVEARYRDVLEKEE